MAGQSKVSRQRHKDKKVILYKSVSTQDPGGYPSYSYIPIHPGKVWAYVRQLSGQEQYAAMALRVEEEMLFVVNWRKDLSSASVAGKLFLEYNDCWYDIKRIDTFEGYKEDLQLYGKLALRLPDASEILPYQLSP